MRQVILDTETTGLEVGQGHRIIELGCVELQNRRRSDRTLHFFLQPDRDIDPGATEVHGITAQMLAGKPRFADVMPEFLAFIADAELVIHNAPFDLGFLNAELARAGMVSGQTPFTRVTDTLALARRLHPGQRNSLDALCKRYNVDNSSRQQHGALLDAELLAEVYLAMTGGQATLSLDREVEQASSGPPRARLVDRSKLKLVVRASTPDDLAAHERQLALIDRQSGGRTLWRRLPAGDP